jgi:hypothetical protein
MPVISNLLSLEGTLSTAHATNQREPAIEIVSCRHVLELESTVVAPRPSISLPFLDFQMTLPQTSHNFDCAFVEADYLSIWTDCRTTAKH